MNIQNSITIRLPGINHIIDLNSITNLKIELLKNKLKVETTETITFSNNLLPPSDIKQEEVEEPEPDDWPEPDNIPEKPSKTHSTLPIEDAPIINNTKRKKYRKKKRYNRAKNTVSTIKTEELCLCYIEYRHAVQIKKGHTVIKYWTKKWNVKSFTIIGWMSLIRQILTNTERGEAIPQKLKDVAIKLIAEHGA